ncbi:DUF1353 domain-containing protein [Larkinella sp. GY13]|uniref:DUF1353 domain-containing protein n=1 Tax=Larkinella sp. GY13 TaxID=3453720 RepID=UPI003EE9D605
MEKGIIVRYREEDPDKSDRWVLVEPLTFQTLIGEVIIPAGYVTDFASVPAPLWSVFPPIGRYNRASLLHDYWYDQRLGEDRLGAKLARKLADLEYWSRIDQIEPHRKLRNRLMYWACRWFGRSWWEN